MEKSNIYFRIFGKLAERKEPGQHLKTDTNDLVSLLNNGFVYPDGKTFLEMVEDVRDNKINKRSRLNGLDALFGIYLDYLAISKKKPALQFMGVRNLRNLLGITPKLDVKSEPTLYEFTRINGDNFTLDFNEHTWDAAGKYTPTAKSMPLLKGYFVGDLLWLYYHEEMGIFKILGALMDDAYRNGSFPIPYDSTAGEIVHANIRQFRMGLASALSDRESTYRRCLGWHCEDGKKLELKSALNENFKTSFHDFIRSALEYYNEKRVIASIQSASTGTTVASINTVMNVRDTIESLRQSFDPFQYGRNIFHTAHGVINVVAGFFMIYHSREFIGVPRVGFESPEDFIPEAIKRLSIGFQNGNGQNSNRYIIYRNAAEYGRDLLLDIEAFSDYADTIALKNWLDGVEDKIESYRTAYRNITGTDLAPKTSRVPAQLAA